MARCKNSGIPSVLALCLTMLRPGILDQPLNHLEFWTAERVKGQFIGFG